MSLFKTKQIYNNIPEDIAGVDIAVEDTAGVDIAGADTAVVDTACKMPYHLISIYL